MTHIYFLTRMPQHLRDIWVANMRSQCSAWIRENLTICECGETKEDHIKKELKHEFMGRKDMHQVQWSLKPVELWEVVVPDEAVPEVLWWNKVPPKSKGQVHDNLMKWKKKLFQYGLKLDDVPDYDVKSLKLSPRLIMNEGVSIYCLGTKKDGSKEYPEWNYKQESL